MYSFLNHSEMSFEVCDGFINTYLNSFIVVTKAHELSGIITNYFKLMY